MTLLLIIFSVVFLIWNISLTFIIFSIKNKNKLFFDDGSKNLRDLVTRSINESKSINQRSAKIEDSIDSIAKIIKNSYQKFSLIRYNPFSDTGGDQSFSLALLDLSNNGFVFTSIHGRDVNRVYAKEIVAGKAKNNLSAEEDEVIKRAINEK
ncbi:MAG: DUF4446 family protein [bacterium]